VHLIVVHFNITSQVSASTFVDTDLFPELCILHLQLADLVPRLDQFSLFLFDKPVASFDLFVYGSVIALHSTLVINIF